MLSERSSNFVPPRYFISMNNDIVFEQVCCYNVEGEQVLKDVSFHLPGNRVLALTGDPGCCMAVLELIAGQRALQGGRIQFGSRELVKLPAGQVHYLQQEAMLPEGTIYQHIAAARPDATEMEVLEAAAAATVLDFTWELRSGIHSSGGELTDVQQCCVGIARASLQTAPVVVMEAPAGDEACVWEAVRALAKDKTVIMTGGGQEMFRYADVVLILKDGGIAVYENGLLVSK